MSTHTAVVDRIEDDLAVLLLEADGAVVDERTVPVDRLPAAARSADAVLQVAVGPDGQVRNIDHDPAATGERTAAAQDRFDRLARRPPAADEEHDGEDGERERDRDNDHESG